MLNFIKEKSIAIVLNKWTNYALALLIFACLVFYVYFANTTVHTLTSLEKIKQETQSLSIDVSELESKRLVIQNSINKSLAISLGFVEIGEKTFIANQSKKTLSLKTD